MADSPDNTSSLYVMATRHKDKDGLRLYTTDLKDIREAAKTIDEKYSALSEREAREIAKEHDGRNRDKGSASPTKEGTRESQTRKISHDGDHKGDGAAQEMPAQKEGREVMKEPAPTPGRDREIEMER
jgi:hypothetical protein